MKFLKTLVLSAMMASASVSAMAKEKLYVVNPGSTGGSFNAIMSAYAQDLKSEYDIEYVQGKGCANGYRIASNLINDGQKVFTMAMNSKYTPEYRAGIGNTASCDRMPTADNFIRADFHYGIIFTAKDGMEPEELFEEGRTFKVGVTAEAVKRLLADFFAHHNIAHTFVSYNNSNDVVLGVYTGEVDFAYTNAPASFFKKAKDGKGLYTLDPNGLGDIASLSSVSDYPYARVGNAYSFTVDGMSQEEVAQFASTVKALHDNKDSNITKYYKDGRGYTNSILDMERDDALNLVDEIVDGWTAALTK